ncbi:MAG: sialidase family protein [Roseiflexaceae bacterium]
MRRFTGLFALLLFGPLLSSALPAAAQQSWSQPFAVSDVRKTPSSWFPDLAIGPEGSVHIIWSSGLPGKKKEEPGLDLLMYRELRDGKWSEINDIDNPGKGGYTVRNSIIMGHDGKLHMLVRAGLVTTYRDVPWNAAWSARDWSEPRNINGSGSYFNALATDSKGALHVLWNEAITDDPKDPKPICSYCADVFYRRSNDDGKTWSSPINLSQSQQGSVKQQIKIDKADSIHAVWEEGFDWYATKGTPTAGMYRRSRDGGLTWDPPVRFTLPDVIPPPPPTPVATPEARATAVPTPAPIPNAPRQLTIGLYQNSAPVVVYRGHSTGQIYYQFSEDGGGAWSKTEAIPGIRARDIRDTDHDDYSMTTDGAGNVHLICAGYLPSDTSEKSPLRLLHLVWNGREWSTPEVIASDESYADIDTVTRVDGERLQVFPEWPRAVIAGNDLHVTWFTRNKEDLYRSDRASYQVWYSVRQLDAPAIAPFAIFTPVPTSAPPTPVPTLAPTAIPTIAPDVLSAPPVSGSLAWEGPGILTLGAAVVLVVGLLAATIGAHLMLSRLRRRAR